MSNTWFKRMNPVNIHHCWEKDRYIELENLDNDLFVPTMLKRSQSYGN